jgi:hypothetical protein
MLFMRWSLSMHLCATSIVLPAWDASKQPHPVMEALLLFATESGCGSHHQDGGLRSIS